MVMGGEWAQKDARRTTGALTLPQNTALGEEEAASLPPAAAPSEHRSMMAQGHIGRYNSV